MNEQYINTITLSLDSWAPLVSSGYECPAAGTVMFQAKTIIEQLQQENKNIKQSLDKEAIVMSEDILKKANELIKQFDKSCSEHQRLELGTHAINLLNELVRQHEIYEQNRK